MTGRPVPVRANFDTFYWSVISVFQIITLDNWNSNMYQVRSRVALLKPHADR